MVKIDDTTSTNKIFHDRKTWESYDSEGMIKQIKLPVILNRIPEDVRSIIDVGCGNGILTNALGKKYDVLGVDISEEALSYLQTRTMQAPSNNIAVPDRSFDLVFSSEMLEHLPDEVLQTTVEEFKRIAQKYILITVPHQEFLPKSFLKCESCGEEFHVSGHLHSFSLNDIEQLFNGDFVLTDHTFFGRQVREYNPFLMRIRHQLGKRWYNTNAPAICPSCGNESFPFKKGNWVSKICNGLNLLLEGKHPYWMLAFFKRADL